LFTTVEINHIYVAITVPAVSAVTLILFRVQMPVLGERPDAMITRK